MSTARHAGYAAVTTVGAELVNGLLAGAASLVTPTTFTLPSLVTIGGESIGLAGSLRVATPTVTFATNPQNLIGVTIGAIGTVRLTANGGDLVEVDLRLTTTLQVGLFVNVSPASLAVGIDLSNATVNSVSVGVTFGPPLATQYNAALQSGPVLAALTSALRAIPKAALTFVVPGVQGTLTYTFSGVTVSLPVSNVTLVPLDGNVGTYPTAVGGCLDIAVDVAGFTSGNAGQLVNLITTVGPTGAGYSVDQFGNVSFGGDGASNHDFSGVNIASIVNVDFFTSFVNSQVNPRISGLTSKGVTVNSVSLSFSTQTAALNSNLPTLQFSCITVSANGSYSGFGFTFDASLTPVSVEIAQPYRLSYSMWLVNYDFSSPFLTILDILLPVVFPWLGVIVDLIINSTIDSIVSNNVSQNTPGLEMNGNGTLPFPGVSGWNLSYFVFDVAVSSSEIAGYMAMKVVAPPAPASMPVFALLSASHALADPSPIPVTLQIARPSLMDPLLGLHISWTVTRDDTGATVISQDTALGSSALAISIDRWSGDPIYNDTWTVTCEVYRLADALTGRYSYFMQTIPVGVEDVVDRHHPYVRWDHTARFHDPSGPGPLRGHQFWSRNRKSRIHRTDILIRCEAIHAAFASGYPQETGKTLIEPKLNVPAAQYLDSIASYGSLNTVERWRHGVLCDYCFFGGPTRMVWKVPTPPTPPFV
jgi:hypothetical protein